MRSAVLIWRNIPGINSESTNWCSNQFFPFYFYCYYLFILFFILSIPVTIGILAIVSATATTATLGQAIHGNLLLIIADKSIEKVVNSNFV